ncbi:hypothetical protein BDV96DRAFT_588444 [Lophiotrema nucula]|uniref:UspA domain-containing protein n=1 Tax=Lophiotrema nucula TaxID=690887 RepID=A0A6A5YL05_9PLEO|nr:hypothetical protein BDV96DRAFT_588444 [Lophiotrema nucula]
MSISPHTHAEPRNASPRPEPRQTVSPLLLPALAAVSEEPRRPSIQFMPHSNAAFPRGSPKQTREKRRLSSPPPPPVFQPRVSFDTFDKPADFIDENSFTLIAKHKDYEYTKRSRTFLCGCDDNEYSEYALQWLIDELVDDGDEIVCLRVVEKDSTVAAEHNVNNGRYRSEAETLMGQIQQRNHENKAINLVLEFAVGKVNKVIDEMINLYEPAILVVGTRGRSLGGFQGLLPGSVSKYCLQHSPVPVIVVRPSSKRDKARSKRAQDPNRHAYKDLLEKSGPQGGHILDASRLSNYIIEEDEQHPSEDEARAVAKAVGYHPPVEPSPLSQAETAAGLDDLKSPGVVMKSPELQNLDSPDISDISSSEEDEQGGVPTETAASEASTLVDRTREDSAMKTDAEDQISPGSKPVEPKGSDAT